MGLKFKANENTKKTTLALAFKAEDVDEQTKSGEKLGRIVGLSAYFNNLDSYNDIIRPGAFQESIKNNPNWAVLRFHNSSRKIGFTEEAQETKKGLKTTSLISLETQDGVEQFALSKLAFTLEKAQDAQSIGYRPLEWEIVEDKKRGRVTYLDKLEMWEHSFVTWGANPKAESTGFKSFEAEVKEGFGLDDYVDDFFKFMEEVGYKHDMVLSALKARHNNKLSEDEQRIINMFKESSKIFKQ